MRDETEIGGLGPHAPLPEDALRARAARGREGRLAGLLFIVCPLASVPSSFLIDPPPPASLYLLGLASILVGLACMVLPWERMNHLWLHVLGAFATVEVTIAIGLANDSYVFFYFFIAVFAAYVAHSRDELAVQLGLISLGLLLPLVYDSDPAQDTVQLALLAIPALGITAGLVFHLRQRLEAERLAYRSFAEEALELTSRIRGVEPESLPAMPVEPAAVAGTHEPGRWRAVALAALAIVLGVPLLSAGLAAAGVSLPGALREPFEQVGIELPNQTADAPESAEPTGVDPVPGSAPDSSGGGGAEAQGEGENRHHDAGRAPAAADTGSKDPQASGDAAPPADLATEPAQRSPTPATPAPTAPTEPGDDLGDALDDRLRDTLDGVNQLLDGLRLNP